MSGNSNTYEENLRASFDNLNKDQFGALFDEVIKEYAKRLLGGNIDKINLALDFNFYINNGNCFMERSSYSVNHGPW